MTESLDKPKKRVLGLTGNMWIYAFGVMGINLAIGLVNSYQAEFFDKIMRLNLVGIALIILAAKFISIVADFVIGNLIDRANFKAGKMRPWILFSAFRFSYSRCFRSRSFRSPKRRAAKWVNISTLPSFLYFGT